MEDRTKVKIVSAGLIILGLYYFYKQKKQDAEIAKEPTQSGTTANTPPAKADWNKVLKKGSKGQEVGILQTALKQIKVDNDFGLLTETRLKNVMKVTQTTLNDYNKFINKK
jgi:hypothetical protein